MTLLLNDKDSKAHFFDEIDKATIFNYRKFIDYINGDLFITQPKNHQSDKITPI
ncbi:site-specific DNA-methyltransferase [thiotrophic endosymbiont of Bathymodiolus puteoserpentis (Logatchev)]|uniref:site-specific DNA-methyltransferase n=1 Tax=thiotrophic endosymbiont of Bathymodiolus puteoserpentis (Logatchev) TaxID=343240 RepID=UPI003CCA3ABD